MVVRSVGVLLALFNSEFTTLTCAGIPSLSITDAFSNPNLRKHGLGAAFYDFDGTLAWRAVGDDLLNQICIENRGFTAEECAQPGFMIAMIESFDDPEQWIRDQFVPDTDADAINSNVTDRLERLKLHLTKLQSESVELYALSTSWEPVSAQVWGDLLFYLFEKGGLSSYLSRDRVLTLDDPGPGIAANKGAVLRSKMDELGISDDRCIFADDSSGNIRSVMTESECNTLYLSLRLGLDRTDLEYIEGLHSISHLSGSKGNKFHS